MEHDEITTKIIVALFKLAVAVGRLDILVDAGFDIEMMPASAVMEDDTVDG